MKKRKKWWQINHLEYSGKVRFYSFLVNFPLIFGIIFGLKYWLFQFSTIGGEDVIFPISVLVSTLFFFIYQRHAKQEYTERDLGHPAIYER
jgi:hypothetical protein